VIGRLLAVAVLVVAAAAPAAALDITLPPDNPYGLLAPGAGADLTQRSCVLCHSTDYIVRQPRGGAGQWQAVVTKMIKVFGAPVTEADAKTIIDYLAHAYGE